MVVHAMKEMPLMNNASDLHSALLILEPVLDLYGERSELVYVLTNIYSVFSLH